MLILLLLTNVAIDISVLPSVKLRWICRKRDGGMDFIKLAQGSDRWHILVNVVMNLQIP
jgi:hypothetical protein